MEFVIHNNEFEKEIEKIIQSSLDKFLKFSKIITLCRNTLSDMRSKVVSHQFSDRREEIEFFKITKQGPLSHLIYYSEINSLEIGFPRINLADQKGYLIKQMERLNNFFVEHGDFVHYINLGQDQMDKYYFTRKHSQNFNKEDPDLYFKDSMFNTSHDRLYAKILAFQRLAPYLENRLEKLENNDSRIKSNLRWTSSKVSLTELIYALHQSTVINNGQAGIAQIANLFQQAFNIDLGDYYHIYSEIRARKKAG